MRVVTGMPTGARPRRDVMPAAAAWPGRGGLRWWPRRIGSAGLAVAAGSGRNAWGLGLPDHVWRRKRQEWPRSVAIRLAGHGVLTVWPSCISAERTW